MRTISCHTMRPAPMFRCLKNDILCSKNDKIVDKKTYPTSELPIKPSLKPTAVPWALRVRYECFSAMLSIFVVSAASIAFPAVPFSGAMPQPSWTLTLEVRKINDGEENYTDIRHTLFFTVATIVVDGKGSQRTEVVVRKDSDSNRTPIDI